MVGSPGSRNWVKGWNVYNFKPLRSLFRRSLWQGDERGSNQGPSTTSVTMNLIWLVMTSLFFICHSLIRLSDVVLFSLASWPEAPLVVFDTHRSSVRYLFSILHLKIFGYSEPLYSFCFESPPFDYLTFEVWGVPVRKVPEPSSGTLHKYARNSKGFLFYNK